MPISFTCPHCGNQTQVADQYASQSGPCASCGQTITVPSAWATQPNQTAGSTGTKAAGGVSVMVIVLSVLGIGGLCVIVALAAVAWPLINSTRDAAKRAQCSNNMKQISLALMNYNDIHGQLPPAYTVDEQGRPMHSWRVLILPYMEHQALFDQYRMDEPWNGPNNSRLASQMPQAYRCPSESPSTSITSYMAIVGPNTPMQAGQSLSLSAIGSGDGTSNTLLVVESTGHSTNWMAPQDIPFEQVSGITSAGGVSSGHSGGANAVFCDGSILFLRQDMSPDNLRGMATAAGGEVVSW